MAEIRTVTTLETKRTDIRNAIAEYERRLAQARADLAHVTACIRLFDTSDTTPCRIPAYADIHRLFKHRELGGLCHQSLAKNGPQDTRELALYAMQAKGLDTGDSALAKAVTFRVIQTLRAQQKRGKLVDQGKRSGRIVWALPVLPLGMNKQTYRLRAVVLRRQQMFQSHKARGCVMGQSDDETKQPKLEWWRPELRKADAREAQFGFNIGPEFLIQTS